METQALIIRPREKKVYRCLSCGEVENMGRRRYCSRDCRQRLRLKLDARVGLVQALNTRYGAFYFSDDMIIMDILPYGSQEIFSFLFPRSAGAKPAEDFGRMANLLGDIWWDEKRRTNKRHLASERVLAHAVRNGTPLEAVKPTLIHVYTVNQESLTHLRIHRSHLWSADLKGIIKAAYRRQAKHHHPDLGGDAETFRKIHKAYEELMSWSERPSIQRRRGLPDKWFYDGESNRWFQPLAL